MGSSKQNSHFLKKIDIVFLGILPAAASMIALAFRTNYLITTLLFFGLGSVWFSYRTQNRILRTALFSILLAFPLGTVVLDYILVTDEAWWSPTIFPWRLFGILPYEDLIWGFFQAYFVIILYEHFFEKGRHQIIGSHFKYFVFFPSSYSNCFLFSVFLKASVDSCPVCLFLDRNNIFYIALCCFSDKVSKNNFQVS